MVKLSLSSILSREALRQLCAVRCDKDYDWSPLWCGERRWGVREWQWHRLVIKAAQTTST